MRISTGNLEEGELGRAEHIADARDRALQYVDAAEAGPATDSAGTLRDAVSSMLSDLAKHEDTSDLIRGRWAHSGTQHVIKGHDAKQIRRWINAVP
jgi:hypothetical protein